MTLSAVLISLVAALFVAQNRFYFDASERSSAQERVRSIAEQIQSEFRAVSPSQTGGPGGVDGIQVAQDDRIVFQAPITMGVVCIEVAAGKGKGKGGGSASAYIPMVDGEIEESRVTGYGVRDPDGTWSFYSNGWGTIVGGGGSPRDDCIAAGDDGMGDDAEYVVLGGSVPGNVEGGSLISLVSEIEFRFMDSELRPDTRALFRRVGDQPLVEFASGLAEDARFQYRVGGSTVWQDNVNPPPQRASIRAIRIVAKAASMGGAGPIEYEWVVDLPLRNAP